MSISLLFICGVSVTGFASLTVVVYLHKPLQKLLVEICGNERRAEFWTAFSAVTVGIVPVIFSLTCRPNLTPGTPALLEIADQLKWGLIGMVVSVLLLGWIIGRFIPRVASKV
jgi:uncharacterized membrane protein YhaH (DUF805 family)